MSYTNGFYSKYLRDQHFDDHGADFGAKDEEEYERMADEFLGGPLKSSTLECIRASSNDLIRYDYRTEEFGILSADRYIKTYYIPKPSLHRKRTNKTYFESECKK